MFLLFCLSQEPFLRNCFSRHTTPRLGKPGTPEHLLLTSAPGAPEHTAPAYVDVLAGASLDALVPVVGLYSC